MCDVSEGGPSLAHNPSKHNRSCSEQWSEHAISINIEKIEKINPRLRIQPLQGGNLLYIT